MSWSNSTTPDPSGKPSKPYPDFLCAFEVGLMEGREEVPDRNGCERLRPRAARQDAVTRMSWDGVAERALALLTQSA